MLGGSGRLTSRPSCFTPGNDPVPIVYEGEWTSGPVWRALENLHLPGFVSRTVQPIGFGLDVNGGSGYSKMGTLSNIVMYLTVL